MITSLRKFGMLFLAETLSLYISYLIFFPSSLPFFFFPLALRILPLFRGTNEAYHSLVHYIARLKLACPTPTIANPRSKEQKKLQPMGCSADSLILTPPEKYVFLEFLE